MTSSTKLNQESITATSNKGENTMNSKNNPVNYSISESVRTDGTDLFIDTDALIQYLRLDHNGLRRLREHGTVFKGQPLVSNNGECDQKIVINNFPSPILIKGRNYWKLSEVRGWELETVRFVQHLNDRETIIRSDHFLQQLDNIETITRSVHDVLAVNTEVLRSKLQSAKYAH